MASESLLSGISPFLRHLRNQWPWISLRGHSRSSILVIIESAYTYSYYWSMVIATWTLSCTFSEIRRLKCRKSTIFSTALLLLLKFGGVPFGLEYIREKVRLISREIIFAEFQPTWSRYLNVSHRQTDGWTDGRTTCFCNTALRYRLRAVTISESTHSAN